MFWKYYSTDYFWVKVCSILCSIRLSKIVMVCCALCKYSTTTIRLHSHRKKLLRKRKTKLFLHFTQSPQSCINSLFPITWCLMIFYVSSFIFEGNMHVFFRKLGHRLYLSCDLNIAYNSLCVLLKNNFGKISVLFFSFLNGTCTCFFSELGCGHFLSLVLNAW